MSPTRSRFSTLLPFPVLLFLATCLISAAAVWGGSSLRVIDLPLLSRVFMKRPPGLYVESQPTGAQVFLDEKAIGHTPLAYTPDNGTHRLRLVAPGCAAWQETITFAQDMPEVRLAPLLRCSTSQQPVASGAHFLFWSSDGTLLFYNQDRGFIQRLAPEVSGAQDVFAFFGQPFLLSYSPDGAQILAGVNVDEGTEMEWIVSGEAKPLAYTGLLFWAPAKPTPYVLGIPGTPNEVGVIQLWHADAEGRFVAEPLTGQSEPAYGRSASLSVSGDWLAVQNGETLEIWRRAKGAWNLSRKIPGHSARWQPTQDDMLAFIGADGALHLVSGRAQETEPEIARLEDPGEAFVWQPGGGGLVLGRFRPAAGGPVFWQWDPFNDTVQLLSEAQTATGHIAEMTIAPDGRHLAWSNSFGDLYLLMLSQ